MGQEFHATYEDGILRLDLPLSLPEKSRVTGTVRESGASTAAAAPDGKLTLDEFERQLDQLALDVPPLPADFSRADIYLDHD